MSRALEAFAEQELERLEREGLLRIPDKGERKAASIQNATALGIEAIDASSNDYLGLAGSNVSRETGVQASSNQVAPAALGAGASRLIHGSASAHSALEGELANWVQLPAALLFTSGYAANIGLISALAVEQTTVFSDALNHASLIDGCRLGRARVEIVAHLNLVDLSRRLAAHRDARARWVVIESCFSMDGDGPDLKRLRAICDEHAAGLVVDEAHALGVFGPEGAGRCAEAGIVPDALVGTLGKAVGSQGAFVAGSTRLRHFLWNRARTFVFSTASSPALAAATLFHVQRAREADSPRVRLLELAARLRVELRARGLVVSPGLAGPIVPVVLGESARALRAAAVLERQGILSQAIRPPTVPEGSARLRLTVTPNWPDDAPARVAAAVALAVEN